MNAKELQIGDWVRLVGNELHSYQIEEIRKEHDIYRYFLKDTKVFATEDEIEPIPLTPEILEKNGFVYSDIPFWQSWQQFGLSIYGTTENYHINCGMNVSMNVSNVHQLQHALKLCGIEKKIEL